jgi:hypothetical protein
MKTAFKRKTFALILGFLLWVTIIVAAYAPEPLPAEGDNETLTATAQQASTVVNMASVKVKGAPRVKGTLKTSLTETQGHTLYSFIPERVGNVV